MLELADIFRDAGGVYRERYGSRMLPSHRKAMRAIEECRTPVLGAHLFECDRCGRQEYSYHSCRNRHCPKCHRQQTDRWFARQRERLPACPYFLVGTCQRL
ncbi:MAG: transposase zinc-binding domain-containing protein [Candidatus Methylomirabilaceae bacterium]